MYSYDNVLSAARGLLLDVVVNLNAIDKKYVIIGGWCPYLRNRTDITHPGTKDVDILFSDANVEGELHEVIDHLLQNGYLPSAKHDFQLLRKLRVGNRDLIFNIDLLHPSETNNNPEMLVDHFDLGILESDMPGAHKKARSLVLPSSQLIFEGLFSYLDVCHFKPDGNKEAASFPLIDEAGLIVSKCQSVKQKKRPRDAFDIFIIFQQANITETKIKLKEWSDKLPPVKNLLLELQAFLEEKPEKSEVTQFDLNVNKYYKGCEGVVSKDILRHLNDCI